MGPTKGIYLTGGKRMLDLLAASAGLLLLSPLVLLIGALLKLTSRGPVFFLQDRVGRSGRIFEIVKFRTMRVAADANESRITVSGDSRVTTLGRVLRLLKIDELPQLWNVLKGDMSLVGPRPELPFYVATYSNEQRMVFRVRPGITDPSSLAYRYEEELLAGQTNPELYYQQVVLPHKLSLNLEYIHRMSLRYDLLVALKTLCLYFSFPAKSRNTILKV